MRQFYYLVGLELSCRSKLLGHALLTFGDFYTILVETKGIINGRLMNLLYDEISREPFTPNRLLCGRTLHYQRIWILVLVILIKIRHHMQKDFGIFCKSLIISDHVGIMNI